MAPPLSRPLQAAPRPHRLRRGERSAVGLFVVPFFVLFTLATLVPVGYAVWMSLFEEESSGLGFGGTHRVFAGFGNYAHALTDSDFLRSFAHVAAYCAVYIPVMVGGALLIALLIDSAMARARRFFQIATFLPHAVPSVIASLIWLYLYTPGLSPITDLLGRLGAHVDFFGSGTVLLSVINISAWQWIGYNVIIFYAALQAIGRETLEAARIDGAHETRIAWSVKIPMIRPTVVLTLLFTGVGAIQLFDAPMLLQSRAITMGTSWTPTMFIYDAAFRGHDYGLAAAGALLLALVAGGLSFVVTKLGNRWKES
ncbi:carbohydrate ABC transporter permease [Streptomyces beihaiensis]|uniref:Sugar ABC transporter permease n=1 Tax=Streptomyces beihaiensis TaxID=2984495 RepID=A0ABT3U037_9ACTN|nr:sugar ABC transporter permease [Streptomyces beihaiensis]MCX3062661.1 sugar ABC transporter permease [Streptomyces beihaiensis]